MFKSNQKGGAMIALAVVLGILLLVGGFLFMSYVSAHNQANSMEKALAGTLENNENILSQYGQKVAEAAQVPDMMRDDVSRVTREALQARYGEEGSKAVFQMLTEQNPQLDPTLYRNIQQIIEGGRTQFQTGQTRLIDQKRAYETALGSFWTGMWMRMAGFPKVDLSKFKAISTERAQQVFEQGKETSPIQIRPAVPPATK